MIESNPSLTSTPAPDTELIISTGNLMVDNFLAQEGDNARELSQWSEIEELFQKWWGKYIAFSYEDDQKRKEKQDYKKALQVLRNELGTLSEVNGGCLMLPIYILTQSFRSIVARIFHKPTA